MLFSVISWIISSAAKRTIHEVTRTNTKRNLYLFRLSCSLRIKPHVWFSPQQPRSLPSRRRCASCCCSSCRPGRKRRCRVKALTGNMSDMLQLVDAFVMRSNPTECPRLCQKLYFALGRWLVLFRGSLLSNRNKRSTKAHEVTRTRK